MLLILRPCRVNIFSPDRHSQNPVSRYWQPQETSLLQRTHLTCSAKSHRFWFCLTHIWIPFVNSVFDSIPQIASFDSNSSNWSVSFRSFDLPDTFFLIRECGWASNLKISFSGSSYGALTRVDWCVSCAVASLTWFVTKSSGRSPCQLHFGWSM